MHWIVVVIVYSFPFSLKVAATFFPRLGTTSTPGSMAPCRFYASSTAAAAAASPVDSTYNFLKNHNKFITSAAESCPFCVGPAIARGCQGVGIGGFDGGPGGCSLCSLKQMLGHCQNTMLIDLFMLLAQRASGRAGTPFRCWFALLIRRRCTR